MQTFLFQETTVELIPVQLGDDQWRSLVNKDSLVQLVPQEAEQHFHYAKSTRVCHARVTSFGDLGVERIRMKLETIILLIA